jgi:hypothetical protein
VQFDNTRIVIRERSPVELLDLSFHLIRLHAVPLTLLLLLNAAPFALLNYLLLGWLPLPASLDLSVEDYDESNLRYYWLMLAMVFLQAPFATSLLTLFLGKAVFMERPKLAEIFADFGRAFRRVLLCQGVFRCALPALLLPLLAGRQRQLHLMLELVALGAIVLAMVIARSSRPFLNEIVLLERNPLAGDGSGGITIAKRSTMLHGTSGGDLFSRWLGAAVVCSLLTVTLFNTSAFLQGVFLNEWRYYTRPMLQIAYPLCLWLVAGYVAVYRFLSYLDLRIHNEGWEVDLLLRAEAARLQESTPSTR